MIPTHRSSGVAVPQGQLRSSERGEPGAVASAMTLTPVAVRYYNERGEVVTELWFRNGDDYFRHPQAEDFAVALRPVKDRHASQVTAILAALEASSSGLTATDTVDVISKQTAAEVASSGVDV